MNTSKDCLTNNHNLYDILGANNSANLKELRRLYLNRAKKIHPDKNTSDQNSKSFQLLQEAWEILSDENKRRKYDAENQLNNLVYSKSIKVDLDDLIFEEDKKVFVYECRCSTKIIVSEDDLNKGCDIFECSSCSLYVNILYERAIC